uniref:transmembrane protein 119b n=1 Tax=Pristiophorus japonicus TaxID=55135 RepID=UPI00398F43D2
MAAPLVFWLLVLTSVGLNAAMPISTDVPMSSNTAESSGGYESETPVTEVLLSMMDTSTFDSSTDTVFRSATTAIPSDPVPIGAAIMDFINHYMILIIIAAILLVLLIIIVCTVVLVKQNYKASAYYPSSYPKKTYVDEQDKRGSAKSFDEVPEKVSDDPKEEGANSSKQLKTDILTVTHNLKKKTPSKGEGKAQGEAAEKGEPSQAADQEGGTVTSPEVGAKDGEGQKPDARESKGDSATKSPGTEGKEEGGETLSKEGEQKGGGEGAGGGSKEQDGEERKDKEAAKKSETAGGTSTNSDQLSAGGMGSKTADKPHTNTTEQAAGAAKAKGTDNAVGPEAQKPKEVKLAQQGLNEANADSLGDLEKTPLIPKPGAAPSDAGAF